MASSSSRTTGRAPRSPESFESLARRNAAAEILQSYEKLSWYSFQRCENIIAGFTEEDEASLLDWKEDKTPRLKPVEEEKSSKKSKERVSWSGAGGDPVAGSSTQKPTKSRTKSEAGTSGSAKKKRRSGGGG